MIFWGWSNNILSAPELSDVLEDQEVCYFSINSLLPDKFIRKQN